MQKLTINSKSDSWNYYADKISKVSWNAGKFLAKQMLNDDETIINIVVLVEKDKLVGFAALKTTDIVPDIPYTPFISTVFVNENFSGNGYSRILVATLEKEASKKEYQDCYIVTQHVGLYEKVGYTKIGKGKDIFGREMLIFHKHI